MYKDFYEFLKIENINYSRNLKIEDSPLKHEVILTQQKILQLLSILDKSITGIGTSAEEVKSSKNETPKKDKKNSEEILKKVSEVASEKERQVNLPNLYEFKRDIVGGKIPELNAVVPEEVVRQQKLNHGDLVIVYEYEKNGNKEFAFLLEEKNPKESKKCRVQFNRCVVQEVASELFCFSNNTGQLKLEGDFFSPRISTQDIREFNIKVGDTIDLAVCKKKPSKPKVIWKYTNEEVVEKKLNNTNTSRRKRRRRSNGVEKSKTHLMTLLGKKILIVSFEHDRSKYEQEIKKRGGELLMGDANDTTERLKNLVRKSDLVIPIITNSSHHAVETVIEEAKALQLPFVTSKSKGVSSNIALAEQVLINTSS